VARRRIRSTIKKTFALDARMGKLGSGGCEYRGLKSTNRRRTWLLGVEEDVSESEENTSSNTPPELAGKLVGLVGLDISERDWSFV